MMRTLWTLRGRLQYILAKGLLQKKEKKRRKKKNDDNGKKKDPKVMNILQAHV